MDELMSSSPATRPQKRMRKGTRSCTECRRRKLRCVFAPGAIDCVHCTRRGSQCIDQRDARSEDGSNATPSRRLDEPASLPRFQHPLTRARDTLEAADSSDVATPTGGIADRRAPLVSVLQRRGAPTPENVVNNRTSSSRSSNNGPTAVASHAQEKSFKSACETLRAAMPGFDAILSVLSEKGGWWDSFRQKLHAVTNTPVESLPDFAARAYTSRNPAILGTLATAYSRSRGGNQDLFALVDSLVVSDFACCCSQEGLECLILLAKSYTDIGQPRRAWLTWRKGMAISQLMGIYRSGSDQLQCLWWAIYHGDRFASLLLGLPHGFNDLYYSATLSELSRRTLLSTHEFVMRCAALAGRIIDRNFISSHPPLGKTIELDDEMEATAAAMPKDWWSVPAGLPSAGPELNHLLERLLLQFYFFHVRVYLFLPYLKETCSERQRSFATAACREPCRQTLGRFLLLRAEVPGTCGQSLFDCKTSDFVAFIVAVVFLQVLSGPETPRDGRFREDWDLVLSVERVFARQETETGCQMSAQCCRSLRALRAPPAQCIDETGGCVEVFIPFFGTVNVVPRTKSTASRTDTNGAIPEPSRTALDPNQTTTASESIFALSTEDSFPLDLQCLLFTGDGSTEIPTGVANGWVSGEFAKSSDAGGLSAWLNMDTAMMDLNQDWSTSLFS